MVSPDIANGSLRSTHEGLAGRAFTVKREDYSEHNNERHGVARFFTCEVGGVVTGKMFGIRSDFPIQAERDFSQVQLIDQDREEIVETFSMGRGESKTIRRRGRHDYLIIARP